MKTQFAIIAMILLLLSTITFGEKKSGVDVDFNSVPFEDVVSYLRSKTGQNFYVNWGALDKSGITKDQEITLKLKNVSYATILDFIIKDVSGTLDKFEKAYWLVDEGIVTITTGNSLNTETEVKVFDVAHLLHVVANFKGPRISSSSASVPSVEASSDIFEDSGSDSDEKEKSPAEKREELKQSIINILTYAIGEDMWKEGGGKGFMTFFQKKLVISQTKLGWLLLAQKL